MAAGRCGGDEGGFGSVGEGCQGRSCRIYGPGGGEAFRFDPCRVCQRASPLKPNYPEISSGVAASELFALYADVGPPDAGIRPPQTGTLLILVLVAYMMKLRTNMPEMDADADGEKRE